jgi:lysophospholipase L1-like esterase
MPSSAPARPACRSRLLCWSAAVVVLGLLGLGGAELFFRAFPQYLPPAAQFRLHDRALKANGFESLPDENMGYLWQPHIRERFEGLNFGFDYSTDARGFRNPGPWPDHADVVVLGDSEAFGFGVNDGEDWVRHMAEGLPGLKVVNLGLIGAAPQQLPKIYQAYGRPLRPEVVLVALFPPNAVVMGQLFHDWRLDGKPDRFDVRRAHGSDPETASVLTRVEDQLRSSYAVLGLYHGLRSALGLSGMRTMTFADGGRVRLVAERYGDAAADAAAGRPEFSRVIDTLAQLRDAVGADGAEMIVLPFPTKEEVHLPLLHERPHELVRPFRRALEQRGIPCLDLTPPLQQAAAAGEDVYFEIDLHPNQAGQELIGRAVSDHLERRFGRQALADRRP